MLPRCYDRRILCGHEPWSTLPSSHLCPTHIMQLGIRGSAAPVVLHRSAWKAPQLSPSANCRVSGAVARQVSSCSKARRAYAVRLCSRKRPEKRGFKMQHKRISGGIDGGNTASRPTLRRSVPEAKGFARHTLAEYPRPDSNL